METAPCNLTIRANAAIVHNPHLNHHQMHLTAKQGKVVLQGRVQSFFEKQMAQEALKLVDGVDSIENELEVSWSE